MTKVKTMARGTNEHAISDWCILRMSGPGTLGLNTSLQDAVMDVWTPTEHIKRRVPRSKSTEHRIVPLAPTYAFARYAHLVDLRRSERMDASQSTLLDLPVLRRDGLRPPSGAIAAAGPAAEQLSLIPAG